MIGRPDPCEGRHRVGGARSPACGVCAGTGRMIRVSLSPPGSSSLWHGTLRLLAEELGYGSVRLLDIDPGRAFGRQCALPIDLAFVVLDSAGQLETEGGCLRVGAQQAAFAHPSWWRFLCGRGRPARLLLFVGSATAAPTSSARQGPVLVNLRDGWMISRERVGAQPLCVGVQSFTSGSAEAVHRHEGAHQTSLMLTGGGWMSDGEESVPVRAGELLQVPAGTWHEFAPGRRVARLLVAYLGVGDPASARTVMSQLASLPQWHYRDGPSPHG
jgi:mannose-6-phosphate isomerase-like protein (cupin superfamily)